MIESSIRVVRGDDSSGLWLVTTAIGGEYFERWNRTVRDSWERYADEHGFGIAVVTGDLFGSDEPRLNGAWQKMLAPRALRGLLTRDLRCALLDTDLFVAPGAASIFEAVPPGLIGVVSQERDLPLPPDQLRNRIALLRREFRDPEFPLSSILNAAPQQVFEWAGLHPFDDYFCAGMFVVDTDQHADALAAAYRDAPEDEAYHAIGAWEEVWINHWVQGREDVHWLDYRWHALWIFEVAAHYPFLYSPGSSQELAQWCLAASLMRNEFVHLAGRWESGFVGDAPPRFPSPAETSEFMGRVRRHERSVTAATPRGTIPPRS